ncbi:carbohydrate-binding protein [Serratia sp. 1D1416]|uniref:PKD domain-containing protein n=1 Tax=Serratia sp. 1D1416 TaxID=2447890 RepID=UPI001013CCD3|nr:carbohydrate-binding protein [Serratia sp. 1D1416]
MNKLPLALLIGSAFLAQSAFATESSRTLSYLTSWGNYGANPVEDLKQSKVDTFLLSFGGWDSAGNISSSDNIIAAPTYDGYWLPPAYATWTQVKFAHPEKKMMVAFGGETYEGMWAHLANPENRENIAKGLVKLLNTGFSVYKKGLKPDEMDGKCLKFNWDNTTCDMNLYQKAGSVYLDGIDFDYEKQARLTPEENDNLLELAKRVRELLGPQSKKLLSLTTYHVGADPKECVNASVTEGCSFIEDKRSSHHGEVLPLLVKGKDVFDFFNVMTYDAGKRFKYDVALANYANAVGDKSKILLGNTINSQWGPEGRFTEERTTNIARAAWQAKNNYGGFFVWTLGASTSQMSLADQVSYINEMHQAAKDAKATEGNQKPIAKVQYPSEVTGAKEVILDGSRSSDPEGETLSYHWEQINGPMVTLDNTDQPQTRFMLNTTDKDVELAFRLTVNDGELTSEPFEFIIKHKKESTVVENHKPTAKVDFPKEVTGAKTVTLDGSASTDPDGDSLRYKWEQIAGPLVVLENSDQPKARFTLGETAQDVDLTFRLTVNDGKLDSDPSEFTIKHKAEKHDDVKTSWKNDKIYVAGDVVIFQGKQYKAKWWTQNNEPGKSDVWESLNKETGGDWNANNVYTGGDEVAYQGKHWIAKWWTKGDKPGTSDVWAMK